MKADYENGAEPERLHMIEKGSEGALYYFDPNRGAAVQMVEMPTWSQLTWHQFHPTEIIRDFRKPYLVITGEQAFTRPGAEQMYQNAYNALLHLWKNEIGEDDTTDGRDGCSDISILATAKRLPTR